MKFNTTRKTKNYSAGDEVTVQIAEIKESENRKSIGMKLYIIEGNAVTNTFFFNSIGDPMGKGSYYLDRFMDAVGVPEGLDIDLNYFVGKRFSCILGEDNRTGKNYLTVDKYLNSDMEETTESFPFSLNEGEVSFMDDKPTKKGVKKGKNPDTPTRIDYTEAFEAGNE